MHCKTSFANNKDLFGDPKLGHLTDLTLKYAVLSCWAQAGLTADTRDHLPQVRMRQLTSAICMCVSRNEESRRYWQRRPFLLAVMFIGL